MTMDGDSELSRLISKLEEMENHLKRMLAKGLSDTSVKRGVASDRKVSDRINEGKPVESFFMRMARLLKGE